MSIRKLPFVLQPSFTPEEVVVGTEESGQIEIERRGYITVGEKSLTQQALSGFVARSRFYALLAAIAEMEDKSPDEVYEDFASSSNPDYLDDWQGDLAKCVSDLSVETIKRRTIYATAILISRVDPEWTVDDTMQLNSSLVEAIADFYEKEDKGVLESVTSGSKSTGAKEKK